MKLIRQSSEKKKKKKNVAMLSKCQIMERFMVFVHILLTSGSFGVCFNLIFLYNG